VLAGIVADAQLVAQDHAGNLCPQLFLGVTLASERMQRRGSVALSIFRFRDTPG